MTSGTLHLARTYRFRPTGTAIKKDGAVWDLTAATVTLIFTKPDGTQTTGTATIGTAASGIAYYDCPTTLLDQIGRWSVTWRVVQGSIDIVLEEPEYFQVDP